MKTKYAGEKPAGGTKQKGKHKMKTITKEYNVYPIEELSEECEINDWTFTADGEMMND